MPNRTDFTPQSDEFNWEKGNWGFATDFALAAQAEDQGLDDIAYDFYKKGMQKYDSLQNELVNRGKTTRK